MSDPPSPLPPALSGRWSQDGASAAARLGRSKRKIAVVPVCLACRLREEGVTVSEQEQERLIDLEMARRVIVWLKAKGIVWPEP